MDLPVAFELPIGIWRQRRGVRKGIKPLELCFFRSHSIHLEPSKTVTIEQQKYLSFSFPLEIKRSEITFVLMSGLELDGFALSFCAWSFENSKFTPEWVRGHNNRFVDIVRDYQGLFRRLEISMKLALKEAFDLAGVDI